MDFLMGVNNPLSWYRNTNARYSPEGKYHFVTVGASTGIPEKMLK